VSNKNKKIVFGIVVLFWSLPVSMFITYTLLKQADVDRLVWFLFIMNIPISFLMNIIKEVLYSE